MPKLSAMPETLSARCGFWPSDLTAEKVAATSHSYDQVRVSNDGVFWRETRPEEQGRSLICRLKNDGSVEDLIPSDYSARSRVHEYGGGEWCLGESCLYFVNDEDQQIYRVALGKSDTPKAITHEDQQRFADLQYDPARQEIVCIKEDHSKDGEPENSLVSVKIRTGTVRSLHQGEDFYASPTISHDGSKLAWLSWNHPHMPWVSSQLYIAERYAQGSLHSIHRLNSPAEPDINPVAESLFQPQFGPDGELYCVSDRSGWWNLHRFKSLDSVTNQWEKRADFGLAQWQFGTRTYDFLDCETRVGSYLETGINHLALMGDSEQILDTGFDYFRDIRCFNNCIYCIAASASRLPAVVRIDPDSGKTDVLRGGETPIAEDELSLPEHFSYQVSEDESAHGYFYPPSNKHASLEGELPPVVVFTHGGPTATTYPLLNLKTQYWTQRGFAVADLNYRGSAGYGRDYRQKLHGHWGKSDVDDCVAAVEYLADKQLIDKERCFIRGNSAGGYTTLCALTFSDVFRSGASLYGISDPARLGQLTHKFESRYLDWLIGNPDQDAQRYADRTPLLHADKVRNPILFFQGEKDRIVLPEQTLNMVEKLKKNGIRTQCHLFPEEHHGFRKAQNQQCVLEEELKFYQASL